MRSALAQPSRGFLARLADRPEAPCTRLGVAIENQSGRLRMKHPRRDEFACDRRNVAVSSII